MKRTNRSITTQLIHPQGQPGDSFGALNMPVYDTAAFGFNSSRDLAEAFAGRLAAPMYSRTSNPTTAFLENKIKGVTQGSAVLSFSSGQAAISMSLLAAAGAGDNIVTTPYLFGNTFSLLDTTLRGWGLDTRYGDVTKPSQLAGLIDQRTRALFVETISNPQLEVADLKALAALAAEHQILFIVDTTATPFSFFNARDYGVDIEVLSSTKLISGGGTSVGGILIDYATGPYEKNPYLQTWYSKYQQNAFIMRLRKEVHRNVGTCLAPHNAFLQSLGLETLTLRGDKACQNTQAAAEFLEAHPQVAAVHYPGLESSPYHRIAREQFGKRPGTILTFDLSSQEDCFTMMDRLQIIKRATNLQDNKTLILHPSSTIFTEFTQAEKDKMQVRDTMIRLSLGIEDAEDLTSDLAQALEGV